MLACGPSQPASRTPAPPSPSSGEPQHGASTGAAPPVEVSLAEVGLDAATMDRSVDPCTDFYRYACGGWLESTEIPVDKARYGRFVQIHERNQEILKRILENAAAAVAAKQDTDPATARLGSFYGSCMDEATVEQAGLQGISALLKRTRQVKTPRDVAAALAELHRYGIGAVFHGEPDADFKNSAMNLLFIDTIGLGLPDRDYYLADGASFARARTFYRGHVERMFMLAGKSKRAAARAAAQVIELETTLAGATKSQVERRDPAGIYNKLDRAGLAALTPAFDWDAYFTALGRPDIQAVSVTTPAYMRLFNALLTQVSPAVWSSYLEWQLVQTTAPTLGKKIADENFTLVREIRGQPEQAPRWQRCIAATDDAMGELLGQLYVKEAFGGPSKEAAETMTREIGIAFAAAVAELSWMDARTKRQAQDKLEAMSRLIGYPATWRDYDFAVDPRSYAKNVLTARAHEVARQLAKADKPYDRAEWLMTPQTVNAYYNPLANQMVFPAGILQPPFFAADRSVAANLGAIGMIVGHELTHGFDDQGAQFDAAGNMRDWWQKSDGDKFREKGQCLAAQYDTFEVAPGLKVNGKLTLGENIADLGGVKLALHAYRNLRKGATKRYVAEGLSEDQQFFVAVGQAWCSKDREAESQRRIVVDSHSPPEFRVNGSLRNTPEFADAFSCAEGSFMKPASTCEVW